MFVNVVDRLPLSITNVSAASGKTYQVVPGGLQQGARVYIDRTYTYTTIPGELQDATYIQRANVDKNSKGNNFLHFSVNQSVTVLVGHDRRITDVPAWLIGWTPIGETLVTGDTTFLLYSKTFPSGPIALGGNHESQIGKSMYGVVVLGGGGSNQSPVANDDSATTAVNTPITIAVLANDTDDGGLNLGSVAVQSNPSHGSTSVDPGTGAITYKPNPDSLEGDIFTYVVQDTTGLDSNMATVRVTVTDVAARVKAGLVVYYPLTEGAGNTVGDQSNVGTPMGLTLSGNVSWATDGNGLVFSNGQVQSSGAATKLIEALQSTNQSTIEVWITPANLAQTGPARILSIGGDTTKQNLIVGQQSNGLAIRLLHTGKDIKAKPRLETDTNVLTTGLLHIVHVYDGTTEFVYVNGVEQPETVVKSGVYSNWDVTDPFTLGNEGNGNRPWAGTLRLVAAYDRPLSSSEVQQNFEAGAIVQ